MNKIEYSNKVEPFILSEIASENDVNLIENIKLKLTFNRFDLAFKMSFLESVHKNDLYKNTCYEEHIKAFTLGSFSELGAGHKKNIIDYENCFKGLLENFKINGFNDEESIIPLAKDNSILNGAHRTAIATYLNLPVTCLKTNIEPNNYNYSFFKERGVSDDVLDYMAQKFIEYSDDCYLAFVWPSAEGFDNEIDDIFEKIVYKRNIKLNYNGAHNLLVEAYNCEQWLGNAQDNYPGVNAKLVECFPNYNDVRVYLFQSSGLDNVLSKKDKIRDLFGIGKHSIHITDTNSETKNLASLIFNENSLHFLNNAIPSKFLCTNEKIVEFKKLLTLNKMNSDDYLLVSGMVMAAYGFRRASDIDYLTVSEVVTSDNIEHHKKEIVFHKRTEQELVNNPEYYFIYKGIKFLSIKQLSKMKMERNEIKDKLDIELMKNILSENKINKLLIRLKYNLIFNKIKLTNKLKQKIICLLKSVKLYSLVKIIFRYIKRL